MLFNSYKNKTLKKIVFYVLALIFSFQGTYAQKKLSIVKLPIEGLSNPSVTAIFQDSKGFLWFGTPNGLNRYDGYRYQIFKHNPEDPLSLSSNQINTICGDGLQRMWVGTKNGLNVFDEASGTFKKYFHASSDPRSVSSNNIGKLFLDSKKRLWIGSTAGLSLYDPKTDSFRNEDVLRENSIINITEDKKGWLWISTNFNGVSAFDPTSAKLIHYLHDPKNPGSLSSNNVSEVYEDKSGNIWIGTHDKGLNKLNADGSFSHYFEDGKAFSIGTNSIYSIFENMNKQLVIGGMHGGMSIYDQQNNNFIQYDSYGNIKKGGNKASIFAHYTMKNGEILISTSDGGVSIYDDYSNGFSLYKNDPDSYREGNPQSLSFNNVKHIYQDKSGNIWIGTDGGGLNLFDKRLGAFRHYSVPGNDADRTIDNTIDAVLEDSDGNFWVGSYMHGLALLDRKNNSFTSLEKNIEGIKLNSEFVHRLYEAKNKILWVGNDKGVCAINKQAKKIQYFEKDLSQNPIGRTEVFLEDKTGNFWIGSENGLFLYNNNQQGFKKVKVHARDKKIPDNYYVLTLYQDHKDNLWISLSEAGLGLLDKNTFEFTSILPDNDFFRENVTNILEDNKKYLWISSSKGLFKCTALNQVPYLKVMNYYNVHDGLQGNLFAASTGIKTRDGELLFGGLNGFNMFHPDQLKINPHVPPLVFTDVRIGGKHLGELPQGGNGLQLNHEQNNISLEFAALNFIKSEKNQYQYKLEGYDLDWIPAGNGRVANYIDLPAGDYVFKVKGSNNDGVWNQKGLELPIHIILPFWKSSWFIAALLFVVLALIFGVYKILLYKVPERMEDFREKLQAIIRNTVQPEKELSLKNEALAEQDEQFLKTTVELIEKKMSDPDFGIETLCLELGVSRAQLYRKIKSLTDKSVSEFIKHIRLQKAKAMLESKGFKISEVSDLVGFKSPAHFSRSFQQAFGISPSEFSASLSKVAENE